MKKEQQEQHHPTPSVSSLAAMRALAAMETLAAHIAHKTPHLHVLDVHGLPRPSVRVSDTLYHIVVGFSSLEEYEQYLDVTVKQGGGRHA